jgi:hypothetical protein
VSADTGGGSQSGSAELAAGGSLLFFGCLLPLLLLCVMAGTLVASALGYIFWPIMLLCKIGIPICKSDSGSTTNSDVVIQAYQSDGKGQLNSQVVPSQYLTYVQDAGKECDQIGPVVIAAQIQQASGFDEKLVGPDGAEGISQLPPDKFKEFGEDSDGNGQTSALDAEDSIMAQARYMCSLAKDIDSLVANNEVKGDRLDMTLAAYKVGLDSVKQAKGVPDDDRAQSYIISVRSGFSMYLSGTGLSGGSAYPSLSPRPMPSQS